MLGAFLALCAAITFAANNVSMRRGVLAGTASQGMAVTVPIGAVVTFLAVAIPGLLPILWEFDATGYWLLAAAGVLHFVLGRYCNYRALKSIGSNLSGPVQEMSLVWTVGLAIVLLAETVTVQQLLGIAIIIFAPMITFRKKAQVQSKKEAPSGFQPKYVEGYTFATLAALSYGTSPLLVAAAIPQGMGIGGGLVGSMISYFAATGVLVLFVLLWPGQLAHVRGVDRGAIKWFVSSGILVCVSQMTRYMALAIAPVSVVTPIQRTASIFRLLFSRIINPNHEIFDSRVYWATGLSLLGVLLLSMSTQTMSELLSLPSGLAAVLAFDPFVF